MVYQETFAQGLSGSQSLLSNFLNGSNVANNLRSAFGNSDLATDTALSLINELASGEITIPISIIASTEINNARGAFAADSNTIYLAEELLATGDVNLVSKVLLEETGHYIDSIVNSSDAPGDEGAIFASLVSGEELDSNQLALLQAEDDSAVVTIDGEATAIEQMATIYVNTEASGDNNGSSWANAYTDLQSALAVAGNGDQIWVAEGIYRPTVLSDREVSFIIPSGVQVYGGFVGGETELEQRNIARYKTILSGDIGTPNNVSDNSHHVVRLDNVNNNTTLDGFEITGGNADGVSGNDSDFGGGIYADNSNSILRNLIITNNQAELGGGMHSRDSANQLFDVDFVENSAVVFDGGGLYAVNSNEILEDTNFISNRAESNGGGGGIYSDSSNLDLDNVVFASNTGSTGGGILSFGGQNQIDIFDSSFLNNSARINGGGIFHNGISDSSSLNISNTIFRQNVADEGGAVYNTSATLTLNSIDNSLFVENSSLLGGGIYTSLSSSQITNSTFADNLSQFGSGIASFDSSSNAQVTTLPNITNSIFWNNLSTFEQEPISDNDGSATEVSFSLVEGDMPGTGNINVDPQFIDPDNFDYRLDSGSSAINSGTNDVIDLSDNIEDIDLAGNPRIVESIVDIGAYEEAELEPVPVEPQAFDETNIIYVDLDATGDDGGDSWENANPSLQNALENAPLNSQIWVAEGTYFSDLDDPSISFNLRSTISLYGGFAGDETKLNQRNIDSNVTVLSGEIGDTSDFSDNTYHVVNASNVTTSAVLDGFTVTGGNAGGGDNEGGGGIYSDFSQATFRNLVLENNNAENGGAIYIKGNSFHVITNTIFSSNNATENGGAVYNQGDSFFFNSTFENNTSESSSGAIHNDTQSSAYIESTTFNSNNSENFGGAVTFRGNGIRGNGGYKVVNSVFNDNESSVGGAIYSEDTNVKGVNLTFASNKASNGAAIYTRGDATPEYSNSIFWNNVGTEDTDQIVNQNEETNTIVRNSIVQGGFSGQDILDSDPLFVNQESGDLRINDNSPAIDAGLNDVVIERQDILGKPRIFNDTVDIGAYEYDGMLTPIDTIDNNDSGADTIDNNDSGADTIDNNDSGADTVADNDSDADTVADNDSDADTVADNDLSVGDTVYRFFNPDAGVHFYTASELERDAVLELPNYTFEGESYSTIDPLSGNAEDVYRFFNTNTGVHLYTTDENERDSIIENLPEFTFEGTAFSAYEIEIEESIPIYRFFNGITGAHFYTPSVGERDSVEENLPDFQSEGIAYYASPLN